MYFPKLDAYQMIYLLNAWRPKNIFNAHIHKVYGATNDAPYYSPW